LIANGFSPVGDEMDNPSTYEHHADDKKKETWSDTVIDCGAGVLKSGPCLLAQSLS
jgi:hypothetical protein